MNNEDYWKERFEQLENSTHNRSVRTVQSIDKELQKAQKTIEGQINAWYQRVAKNNDITMQEARKLLTAKELKEFKWDVQEYIKYGRENELDARWLKELENASARVHISRLEQIKLQTQQACEALYGNQLDEVDRHIRQVYQSDYYHTLYEVQRGINVGWNVASIDENQLSKIISKPWAVDGKNFSDRIWGSKSQLINSLHTNITQMCMLGQAPDKAIRNIEKAFGSSRYQASRLVMTESAYFSSVARVDAFKELDVEEFEVVATLDSHTSNLCRDMDGQHFPMSEFVVGVTAPPFHPNCRTTTCPYFADDEGTRVARDDNGNLVYVPSNMTYHEWKGNFVGKVDTPVMKNVISKTSPKYKEVKTEWLKEATPNSHIVTDMNEYTDGGNTYIVDGKNVLLDYTDKEKAVAELLERTFGGELYMIPKVLNPKGVSTPDYLFRGQRYDLKELRGRSKNLVYNAIAKKKRQADNFILDISNCPLNYDDIKKQIQDIFEKSTHTRFVQNIVVIMNDEVIEVYSRVK